MSRTHSHASQALLCGAGSRGLDSSSRQATVRSSTAVRRTYQPGRRWGVSTKHSLLAAKPRPAMLSSALLSIMASKGSHSSPMLKYTTVCISKSVARQTSSSTSAQPKEWNHSAAWRAQRLQGERGQADPTPQAATATSSRRGATKVKTTKSTAKKKTVPSFLRLAEAIMSPVRARMESSKLRFDSGRMSFPRKPLRSMKTMGMKAPMDRKAAAAHATTSVAGPVQRQPSCCSSPVSSLSGRSGDSSEAPAPPSCSGDGAAAGESSQAAQCVRRAENVTPRISATEPNFRCM
mmetsp:Transcript_46737/g.130111  ORF Transcript_46737/g.130111 Transcript_46737/m.130111 type:complete len:292 (-) Transcript_46737:592-1467(-)